MTAIAFNSGAGVRRSATAQATTGQTDWVIVPAWARYCYFDYNLTDVGASTTPKVDLTIKVPDAQTLDDSTGVVNFTNHSAFTQITAAARVTGQIGPGVTGIADDVTTAATGQSNFSINAVLPPYLGFKVLNDRADADEVYTYTLTVNFKQ